MLRLKINVVKCRDRDCNCCETMLPGFRRLHGGYLVITGNACDEEIRAAARRVQAACPYNAIVFGTVP